MGNGIYDSQGKKIGTLEKESDNSSCGAAIAGIVIVVFIVAFLFVISPLAMGLWLITSLFTIGWKKDTQILTAVWIVLCLLVPSAYYLEWFPFLNKYFPWLHDIIWVYYVLVALALVGLLFWGIYKAGIALLNPSRDTQYSKNTKIIIGGVVTILFIFCTCLSLSVFIYWNN